MPLISSSSSHSLLPNQGRVQKANTAHLEVVEANRGVGKAACAQKVGSIRMCNSAAGWGSSRCGRHKCSLLGTPAGCPWHHGDA